MKTTFFNLLLAGLFISAVVLTGCSKSEAISDLNNNSQQVAASTSDDGDMYPQTAILNRDFVIIYALDGAKDITPQFTAFAFKFAGKEPSGEAQVWNGQMMQSGTWNMQAESGILRLFYPTNTFPELAFLNRNWTIGESSSAVIRLIAADGDEVQLSPK
jgi:hypothetical protein